MKSKSLLFFVGIVLLFSSCVSTNRSLQSSPVTAKNVDLDPIKADIKVDETKKLKGLSTSTYFLFFRVNGDSEFADGINYSTDVSSAFSPLAIFRHGRLQKVRGAAAYKALSTGDYDVLVHPTYIMTIQNYIIYKKYSVVVEGYGAKYSNFRTEKQKIVIASNGKEYIFPDK